MKAKPYLSIALRLLKVLILSTNISFGANSVRLHMPYQIRNRTKTYSLPAVIEYLPHHVVLFQYVYQLEWVCNTYKSTDVHVIELIVRFSCGSGLSGECLTEQGHIWVGVDISPAMLGKSINGTSSFGRDCFHKTNDDKSISNDI